VVELLACAAAKDPIIHKYVDKNTRNIYVSSKTKHTKICFLTTLTTFSSPVTPVSDNHILTDLIPGTTHGAAKVQCLQLVCYSSMLRVYACVFCSISMLFVYMCVRMP